jgi:hypothetical protein
VFLLVASLVLLVSPLPASPDARSNSPASRSFADVLVQGDGVAAAGGRSLAAPPIVDGLLARVPADEVGDLSDHPAGRGVAVGVLDTGIAASGDLAGRVVASADLSGEWSFTDSYGHGTLIWPG